MKRQDIITLVIIAFITGMISMILAGVLFSGPKKDKSVPAVEGFDTSLPDVKHNPRLNKIFNENALDPTQPVQIGPAENTKPFNSPQ